MPVWMWLIVAIVAGGIGLYRRIQDRDALAARKAQLDAAANDAQQETGPIA